MYLYMQKSRNAGRYKDQVKSSHLGVVLISCVPHRRQGKAKRPPTYDVERYPDSGTVLLHHDPFSAGALQHTNAGSVVLSCLGLFVLFSPRVVSCRVVSCLPGAVSPSPVGCGCLFPSPVPARLCRLSSLVLLRRGSPPSLHLA